ncbi:T-lymphocyte surface antigen Ly-9-like [Rhinatrema bivittatum]|uniref:T-lymphocyte surface antigen Ly-9-like n=1 Tax=Rhinatrema bivittatum TaxID=194408 RepID=UPI001127E141|nr:T-lymphocyte surface antigen Ly-9-like [Rhinatrema bivittatum]
MIYLLILLSSVWGTGLPHGANEPQEVSGILGESVTLPLQLPKEMKVRVVFWSSANNLIAIRKAREALEVADDRFAGRLSAPAGNFSLQILNLTQQDGGPYAARVSGGLDPITQKYNLRVLKRVPTPDVESSCTETVNGGYNATLYCSVKEREEGVSYTWSTGLLTTPVTEGPTLHLSMTSEDSDLSYTCTAGNRASTSSVVILPWRLCTGRSQRSDEPQEVSGILGESVTLPLQLPKEMKVRVVFWSSANNLIAIRKAREALEVADDRFAGRLSAPAGNFSLQILNLTEQDGGPYAARVSGGLDPITQKYNLRVLRRLPIPDVKANCTETMNGGCNATLHCSVKDGGEGVIYTWSTGLLTMPVTEGPILHLSMTSEDSNLSYTCTAENRASVSSVAVSPWRLCEKRTSP